MSSQWGFTKDWQSCLKAVRFDINLNQYWFASLFWTPPSIKYHGPEAAWRAQDWKGPTLNLVSCTKCSSSINVAQNQKNISRDYKTTKKLIA